MGTRVPRDTALPAIAEGGRKSAESRRRKPTKNAIDHAIPGIGTNIEEPAKYWAKWRGKATHIDPTTKNTVAFDEAKGVLVIIKDRYIHGYRMTKEKFLEKFDPLPSS
ncbi:hypothetical protein [Streptomyces sp. Ncost-T10-10d]|uniref:hypothetical protein n=1 Tax=Streptomyces sp. Ncost-T10-10d TaxID=1839774 RepID=UPI00114C9BFD|nr:hypothetical protein [Streptomyces sp. Ncost-T10-10d]